MTYFVAFPSQDKTHAATIARGAQAASSADVNYIIWSLEACSGAALDRVVESWLNEAEGIVADLTYINDNVTYELGYAIGAGKDIRLIRNASVDITDLKEIGLFDTLLRDEFKTRQELEAILKGRATPPNRWVPSAGNDRQPIYSPSGPTPTQFN